MNPSDRPTLPSLTARLGVVAIALLALGACADDNDDAADQPSGGTRPGYPAAASDSTSPDPSMVAPSADPTPSTPASAPTSAPSAPTESSEPALSQTAAPEPELIAYAGGEAEPPLIETRADARQLTGAPRDFQDFVGRAAEELNEQADCDGAAVGITVDALRTDGYAVGAVNECGGYAAMWARTDGEWLEIQGTQDTWDCAVLKQYRVPSDLLLGRQTCFDYDGDKKEHAYRQA